MPNGGVEGWGIKAVLMLLIFLVAMVLPSIASALSEDDTLRVPESTADGPFSAYLSGKDHINEDISLEQLQQEDDASLDASIEVGNQTMEEESVASSSSGSLSLHEFSQAKILEDKEFDYSSRSSFKEDAHTKFADIQPRQFYGPPALGFLDGICIKHEVGRFEYTICPFQNITNKRVSSHRISLLGKWDGWTIHDSTDPNLLYNYSLMSYGRGDACGGDTKSVTLTLDCGEEFNALEVVNVDENAGPCGYSIVLGLPIHCSLLLGSHPSVYLGNQNVKNTDNNSRGPHGHIEEGSDVSLSELLAVEESRLAEGGSFRTEDSTNTESYAEQVKALKKQVKDLTAQLEVALMAREVVE